MRKTTIEVQHPGEAFKQLKFEHHRKYDPEYMGFLEFVKLEFIRPWVAVNFPEPYGTIHIITEWSKQEVIQLRDKLSEMIKVRE